MVSHLFSDIPTKKWRVMFRLAVAGAGPEGMFGEQMGFQVHLGPGVSESYQESSSVFSGPWDSLHCFWALGVGFPWYLHSP